MIERLSAALEGRYRIERKLGEGGMATVYLADDLRHGRKVAVKVLRPELAAVVGAERFLAEIKTTAALQHPHILPLHDSGEADGFLFYVMPYIEGESLRERLDRERQLPVGEAVAIARKVASALEYAHEQDVIHRDVKPANILLSRGEPLVADFGIALALSEAGGGRITETGLSLGTPHYMSPEQAAGERTLDPRSDVYALGCVLYEMLAGEPPFPGPTAQAVLARILTGEPRRVTETRRTVPPHLDAVVARSLEKLPADRFESAEAFREALDDEAFAHATTRHAPAPDRSRRPPATGPTRAAVYGLGILLVLAVVAGALGWLRPAPEIPVSRFKVSLEPPLILNFGPSFALSPDGTRLLYRGLGQQLWLRSLASLEARAIPRTEGARTPFFSPDGQSVGFHVGNPGDGGIRIFSLAGSPPVEVAPGAAPGASWGEDGFIYFRADPSRREPGIWRVRATGGEPALVLAEDSAAARWFPEALPGGRGMLALRSGAEGNSVVALDFESGEVRPLVAGAHGRFVGGRLFWLNPEATLMSAPFDPVSLELTGAGVPLAAGILDGVYGTGQYDVSENGILLYQQGIGQGGESVAWVDRSGRPDPVAPDGWPELASDPDFVSLSPDGQHLALTLEEEGGNDQHVWSYDLSQGTLNRLTVDGSINGLPLWMPDARTISFMSNRAGTPSIFGVPFDGSAAAHPLIRSDLALRLPAWHPDGERFLVSARGPSGGDWDILTGRLGQDSLAPFLVTGFNELSPRLSPDGRWVAYVSNQSGRPEIHVRAFPEGGRVWTVSREGGTAPVWSPSGDELFYVNANLEMVAVEVSATDALVLGAREVLFSLLPFEYQVQMVASYDVAPDGRFLLIQEPSSQEGEIVVVQGLFRELDRDNR